MLEPEGFTRAVLPWVLAAAGNSPAMAIVARLEANQPSGPASSATLPDLGCRLLGARRFLPSSRGGWVAPRNWQGRPPATPTDHEKGTRPGDRMLNLSLHRVPSRCPSRLPRSWTGLGRRPYSTVDDQMLVVPTSKPSTKSVLQDGKRKAPMRVFQLKALPAAYSAVNQNTQSFAGSSVRSL